MTTYAFFQQERDEACIPACIRMVLAGLGRVLTEAELYDCCQTATEGTLPNDAMRCVQSLGFDASAPRLVGLDDLHVYVNIEHRAVIVIVNLSTLLGVNLVHAVIIETLDQESDIVRIVDPAFPPLGQRIWPLGLFEIGWRMARNQVILIAPKPAPSI